MKKTIIALFALAGAALAETGAEFNTRLQQTLEEANYELGDAFTITTQMASIQNSNKGFVTITDSYYIVNQQHLYWGLNNASSNDLTSNGEWTLSVSDDVYTYTSTDAVLPILWAQNATGTESAQRAVGDTWIGVTIASDGTDSSITLTYGKSSITDKFILKGTVLDATQVSFMDNINDVQQGSVVVSKLIPEPATATLSLLALAGLAARRRR